MTENDIVNIMLLIEKYVSVNIKLELFLTLEISPLESNNYRKNIFIDLIEKCLNYREQIKNKLYDTYYIELNKNAKYIDNNVK